ncbi:efflux RND transporter periplasmic adaptor subunit [Vibrio ulleungensis]|uniref:Efflux RND transporter periplasmic adaptor subunit n=1 Tax=Vibrio ulleungensis TaxID=2807619 RepID=A0ABS2HIL7_9VIBR|nr:efflux RND transporter periplasmic adaptor subunit [Vibrio ulleungensis]MBM7035942.1 efflux RND transporter periplasmic adaptor subunit [Vibrio ulleungensis]
MKTSKIAFALISTMLLLGCEVESKESLSPTIKPVKMSQYQKKIGTNQHRFLGEVVAANRTVMSFRVAGEVTQLDVEMGEHVAKGDVIATLDQKDYQLALAAKQAELDLARAKHQRSESLYSQSLISRDRYDQSVTQFEIAQAERDQARTELNYSVLKAPFDGMVSIKHVLAHEVVGAQQPVVTLVDTQSYEVRFDVPVTTAQSILDADFGLIFRLDAKPNQPLMASVTESFIRPDQDTNTFQITASLEASETLALLPGMSGTVEVAEQGVSFSTSIPTSSWIEVTATDGITNGWVWIYNPINSEVSKRHVTIDHEQNTLTGINDGEYFVTTGVSALQDGQQVRPWVRERGI